MKKIVIANAHSWVADEPIVVLKNELLAVDIQQPLVPPGTTSTFGGNLQCTV